MLSGVLSTVLPFFTDEEEMEHIVEAEEKDSAVSIESSPNGTENSEGNIRKKNWSRSNGEIHESRIVPSWSVELRITLFLRSEKLMKRARAVEVVDSTTVTLCTSGVPGTDVTGENIDMEPNDYSGGKGEVVDSGEVDAVQSEGASEEEREINLKEGNRNYRFFCRKKAETM